MTYFVYCYLQATCWSRIVAPLRICARSNFLPTTIPRRQPFEILRWRNTSQDILCDDRQEGNTGRHIQPCNKLILMRNPDDGRKCGRFSAVLLNTTSTQSTVTTTMDIWRRDLRQETVRHHGNHCCIVKGNRWSPALRRYQLQQGTLPPRQVP